MNLTISPFNISEGDTTVMECTGEMDPPSSQASFSWTLNGETVKSGQRININTSYDYLSNMHTSLLTLTDASWKDTGK